MMLNMMEVGMPWTPMRGPKSGLDELPSKRGRFLLKIGKPLLSESKPRWVHFSWLNDSFCIRDYVGRRERRQEPGLTASDVWRQAVARKPATGIYFTGVENSEFWSDALRKLDEET